MKEFDYKMRGESSPQGRQRVYFSCHPDDFDLYFNEIAQLVWKDYDCTIWFFQDEVDDEREYTHRLREMQLFIVPITPNFLLRPNRARDFDLQYALDHNIPILPLMQVPGLDALYAKICGDLHYIDKNVCDITTLPYEQKVRKYLSHFLVDDEMLVKIREAFYARIFLSYRKKDRALANQLMELIHNIPFCRDISIWFDEYLVPGEHFNDAIKSALQSSRLFVLCVTENLVNEDNYIQTVEYPKAKELQLPIIPVISSPMTGEQMGMLKEKYKGIPDCIDTADQTQLVRQLSMNFSAMAASDKPDDPMHLYFIGLAYLNGIEVEINHTRAVALIAEAAERNYLPAIEKLAHMYRFGEGVARNREKALELYEKLIAQQHSNRQKLYVALFDTLEFLLDSGELFQHLYAALIKKCTFRILEASAALSLSDLERFQLYSMIAFVNAFDDQVFEKFIEESLAVLPTLLTDDAQTMSAKAFF